MAVVPAPVADPDLARELAQLIASADEVTWAALSLAEQDRYLGLGSVVATWALETFNAEDWL